MRRRGGGGVGRRPLELEGDVSLDDAVPTTVGQRRERVGEAVLLAEGDEVGDARHRAVVVAIDSARLRTVLAVCYP